MRCSEHTSTVPLTQDRPQMDPALDGEGCAETLSSADMSGVAPSTSASILAANAFRDTCRALIRASAAVPLGSLLFARVGELGTVPAAEASVPLLQCFASNASSRS